MLSKRIEKYAIFSKDFRGLPNGWHNVRSCNYLVGENSTGKSSFLQLVEILDSRSHMLFFDIFGAVESLESGFDVHSRISGRRETTIGFLMLDKPKEEQPASPKGRLVTYKTIGGELKITKVTIFSKSATLRLKRGKNRISYKFENYDYNPDVSHADNGSQLEKLHESSGRFTKHYDLDWNSKPETFLWLDALNTALKGCPDDISFGSFNYTPLNCLAHGPMRSKTRRLHHGAKLQFSSTGEHTPFMLRDVFSETPTLAKAINDFGKVSGLFDEITIGTIPTKVKDKPFVLQVRKSDKFFYVDELGFGVGQILPIITDLSVYPSGTSFLIQQPELHLHPKAQAALGDVFFRACVDKSILFVETHSDFIIDRYRMAKSKSDSEFRSQVIYFDKSIEGHNICHEIEIGADGSYLEPPENFRSFFLNESMDVFENL